ncbi:ComEC/Rec2 family competence protein [Butyrivibrio sp. LB2008]|uniref:ComEC/Rec2 family competence protein n=1 Tax=Butyrivibrio sp. LB2008 TaxID=1408305 RepID=UPI0004788188|nr:MBL fold metallo-hydrolase [Butyrivibrio sp. LB2008]
MKNKLVVALTMIATIFSTASCNRNSNALQPGDDTAEEVYADEASKNLTPDPDSEITITAFKCGKADAFLLRTANHTVVIDTATEKKGDNFLELIDEQGIDTIDEIIITHFDKDHIGGADQIIRSKNVGKVYTTYLSKDSDDITEYYKALKEKGYKDLIVKDVISFKEDGVVYTIYPPEAVNYKSSLSNNSSLAIKVQCADKTMLFTGDAEEERINELISTDGLECDVLKMPHHGRFKKNLDEFLNRVNPKYAIITASKKDHEDAETVGLLDNKGVETYITRDGDITITMNAEGITIEQ